MATASEILSIVPLQRAKNTSVEPLANQRQAPPSGPAHKPIILARPQTSAATGTILKGTERRTGLIFQLSFKPSFTLLTHAMADTQVDSGSDISAKVSPTWPRGAARLRGLTGDPDSPEGSAASSRSFALWYRIRSLRVFGN